MDGLRITIKKRMSKGTSKKENSRKTKRIPSVEQMFKAEELKEKMANKSQAMASTADRNKKTDEVTVVDAGIVTLDAEEHGDRQHKGTLTRPPVVILRGREEEIVTADGEVVEDKNGKETTEVVAAQPSSALPQPASSAIAQPLSFGPTKSSSGPAQSSSSGLSLQQRGGGQGRGRSSRGRGLRGRESRGGRGTRGRGRGGRGSTA